MMSETGQVPAIPDLSLQQGLIVNKQVNKQLDTIISGGDKCKKDKTVT